MTIALIERRGALLRRSIIIAASERSEPAASIPAAGSSAELGRRCRSHCSVSLADGEPEKSPHEPGDGDTGE